MRYLLFFYYSGHNFRKPIKDTSLATPNKPREKSTSSSSVAVSPGRRVGIFLEYIDQLRKLHTLLESGETINEQYDDLQGIVLSDLIVTVPAC